MTAPARPARRPYWPYLSVIVLVHLLLPLAFFEPFFTWWGIAYLLIGNVIFGSIGVNLGFHRLLTHRSVEVPRWLERVFVTCGVCSLEGSPLRWVATHRMHHQHGDDDHDPHSPKESFFWGHVGWVCTNDPRMASLATYERYVPDLMTDKYLRWLHRRDRWQLVYLAHVVVLLALAAAVGAMVGGWDGAVTATAQMFAWGVIVRTVYVWHITWFVNSAGHRFGYRNYATPDLSKNTWWVALLTNGEGWHNNHHAAPRSASHGHRWWEMDLTYSFVRLLEVVGLAKNVVPVAVPKHRVEGRREEVEPAAVGS